MMILGMTMTVTPESDNDACNAMRKEKKIQVFGVGGR